MANKREQDTGERFWETKTLAEMDARQWESLCDGCGKCCLHKLEDEDTGEIHYTNVVCRYFNEGNSRCTVYEERKTLVPTCVKLSPANLGELYYMPSTCAYRLLYEGKKLPVWHPLLAGKRKAMVASGNSISGKVISEEYVHEDGMDEHIVRWVN